MNKKVVIISKLVDNMIKDIKPDVEFFIFKDLTSLSTYLKSQAIRANTMIMTRDALEPSPSIALSMLGSTLDQFYLRVDNIEYITEKASPEINVVQFFKQELRLDELHVVTGALTREYVTDYICGNLKSTDMSPERRYVVRRSKADWKKEQINNKKFLEDKYTTEEDILSDIPNEDINDVEDIATLKHRSECQLIKVSGIECRERTLFYFILAQYTSKLKKTVIIDRDFKYHTLSDMVLKSGVQCTKIRLSAIFIDINKVLNVIRQSSDKLIVIVSDIKDKYNYMFISNLIYNTLSDYIDILITEDELYELSGNSEYLLVIPNNAPDLLRTVDNMPSSHYKVKYVMVDINNIEEVKIVDKIGAESVMKQLMPYMEDINITILRIISAKLSGNIDLSQLIE